MGNQDSSIKLAEMTRKYHIIQKESHVFFGKHQLLINKIDPSDCLICKQMVSKSTK